MPITLHWDDTEQTIIRWDFQGTWDWQEVYACTKRSTQMREEVEHPVSVILNMDKAGLLKPGALNHAKVALQFSPDNRDMVVVVGRSTFLQTMVEIFSKMNVSISDSFTGVESLAEARRIIGDRREANHR